MRNSVSRRRRSYVKRFPKWFLICVVPLMAAGGAFAQNARTPLRYAAATVPYDVGGLALGARVDFESPAYRGYQCSVSELFPDFMRCQRTQRQQDYSTFRSFETTNSILHDRDGKAVYINRHIAPWSFDRNEFQDEIKRLSSRFGERAREMRLPPREGVQAAIIAVWGKIQLTELDADAISILASGESPRKGLLIDYLGNLKRSAQLGFPVYSITGGPGYLWSAGVDRSYRGHIRVLAVDPAALSVATAAATATAASPAPAAEPPGGEILPENETAVLEKASADSEPVVVEAKTSIETGVSQTEVEETVVPEPDKIAPLLARLEAAEAKSRLMERLTYWILGGLIIVMITAASLLLRMRKKASAPKLQISASGTRPESPAPHVQISPAQPGGQLSAEQNAPDVEAASQDTSVADAILLQNRKEQKQEINIESGSQKQEAQLVAVNDKKDDGAELASADVIACARCNRESSKNDKFCIHCGASSVASENRASTTRLCSFCQGEIGISDKFCRHCGASPLAVASSNGNSASLDCARGVDHNGRVDEVVASTRTSVKKKRSQKRAREPS
ncbi:MAG: zinc ribbon domain-containing protein [Xanthobacteraceae bacterium]